jgi:hypothetical protein
MGYLKLPWRVGSGKQKDNFYGSNTIIAEYRNDEGKDWIVPIVEIPYGVKDAEKIVKFIVEACNNQGLDRLPE